MKKKSLNILALICLAVFFSACGESTVEIGENTYQPKIVIEGFLQPGKPVENIRITRNFPLNTKPDPTKIILFAADVKIVDLQNNKSYQLTFNQQEFSFEYTKQDLSIDYEKSYQIIVNATIDGNPLSANAITKIPHKGFKILQQESVLDSMKYRQTKIGSNIVDNFKIVFTPSFGTTFYGISIVALDSKVESFIFNNPYINVSTEDLKRDFDMYKYQSKWLQNVKSDAEKIIYKIDWLDTWFYGNYRVIVYAGDENYRLFYLTYRTVQEFDGNFHEPRINIKGDGIGVFGSVIADTVFFKVLK